MILPVPSSLQILRFPQIPGLFRYSIPRMNLHLFFSVLVDAVSFDFHTVINIGIWNIFKSKTVYSNLQCALGIYPFLVPKSSLLGWNTKMGCYEMRAQNKIRSSGGKANVKTTMTRIFLIIIIILI